MCATGAGFYESDGIVLRLTHASGQQKLVRGKLGRDRAGSLIVTAEAPSFSESGPGDVSVAVSFEEGTRALHAGSHTHISARARALPPHCTFLCVCLSLLTLWKRVVHCVCVRACCCY